MTSYAYGSTRKGKSLLSLEYLRARTLVTMNVLQSYITRYFFSAIEEKSSLQVFTLCC